MQNQYGPSIVLGVIIGGAIIADDFIRPHPHHGPMAMALKNAPPGPDADHKVWVMKQAGDENITVHGKTRIITGDDPAGADRGKTIIMVKVNDDPIDAGASGEALADAIRDVVDAARAEGREPTEEEITAAVTAISGPSSEVEVEVDVTEVRSQPD